MSEQEKTAKKRESNYQQLDGFLLKLAANFKRHFCLGLHFDIDEMCMYFKGRCICKCYNPNKPENGILFFLL